MTSLFGSIVCVTLFFFSPYPFSNSIDITGLFDTLEDNLDAESCNGWRKEMAKQQFDQVSVSLECS